MNAAELINQTSGRTDYGTPEYLANAARLCMGSIELDPASSEIFNRTIQAERIHTSYDDGLKHAWRAKTCWMNHPFHRQENACRTPFATCTKKVCKTRGFHITEDLPGNAAWINKLVNAHANYPMRALADENKDFIGEACCLTYALTSELWFRPLLAHPHCLLYNRTSFHDETGAVYEQNTKGCCVTYLGPNLDLFTIAFSPFGAIRIPYP